MSNFSTIPVKGLLQVNREIFRTAVRNHRRINVQKPLPPHYNRAKIEYLVKPKYFEKGEREAWFLPLASQCLKEEEIKWRTKSKDEENPYEQLLAKDLRNWFENSKLIAFFHSNPIRFDDRFVAEVRLKKENMYLKKYGKSTLKIALEGTPYLPVMQLFISHTEIVFCNEPKVEQLLKIAKKLHFHVLLAAIVEGRLLSVSQLTELSRLKDLTTARAQLVGLLNAAQTQLTSGLTYHQNCIVTGLQQYATQPANENPEKVEPVDVPEKSDAQDNTDLTSKS